MNTARRNRQRIRWAVLACLCVGLAAIDSGCGPRTNGVEPTETPEYRELAAAHNERVIRLERVYGQGVIELRRRGRLPEQGNVELWIQQPRHTAVRVEKLGEVLAWLGSDDQRYWMFDLAGDERVLRIGRHDQPEAIADGALDVRPLALLDLMGMTPLDPDDVHGSVAFSSGHNAWMIQTRGRGGPMRLYLDRNTHLPLRVESLTDDGQVALYSTLGRYESVRQEGVSPLTFPRMAHLIDIYSNPELSVRSDYRDVFVKIALAHASSTVDQAQLQRVFDLNRLIQGLRPTRIEEPGTVRTAVRMADS